MIMNSERIVKSSCDLCSSGCGVLVHLKDERITRVEGDPDSPISRGNLCAKGLSSLEYLYSSSRIRHPLKRVGERGEGKWQQISWEEALSTIADKINQIKKECGAQSVAFVSGANKGMRDVFLIRFANAFGSPNHYWAGYTCFVPRMMASLTTYGYGAFPDYEYPPACLIVWGANARESRFGEYKQTLKALDKGTKLIVIDPIETELAGRADEWLRPRPCSDGALALGMLNVIINEDLYDKDFVGKWTVGFKELKQHIQKYSPEKVEEITWIPSEKIKKIARYYATNKPACIQWGNGLDTNRNSFQSARAIAIIRAITGNLGIPGGELQWSLPPLETWQESRLEDLIKPEVWNSRVEAECKTLPIMREGVPQSLIKAILQEQPYPIHAIYMQGCNPLLSWANSNEVYKALKKLDFFAVAELFMTPTAAIADIVLPAATYLEFNSIFSPPYYAAYQIQRKVTEVDECWSDMKIINELAKKAGLGKYFWKNEDQALDQFLKPTGVSLEEFKKLSVIEGRKNYRSYEQNGFQTPSGKVELYSKQLEEWGYEPLPVFEEIPGSPYYDPGSLEEYPFVLTSLKAEQYRHSGGKQIETLRGAHHDPIATIHEEVASKIGVKDGDWLYIETRQGRIKQKAAINNNIDQRVVIADYGWWFPERGISDLFGWSESNINVLTSNKPPSSQETGSPNFRGIGCKVYKVN